MNSLLSQLFMNVDFRRFILSANITSPADQPLLVETQKLFANMQDSYAKFADSSDFASVIPGMDGLPIDVSVQMDVDEFFAQLFDLWELQLLSDKDKDAFRKFYRGSYVTQIRPSDCIHVSEKIENFNALQLEVRGKSTLQESLKAYVEGDVMEGENKYQCTQCDGGRYANYAVKRTCLKEIPDSLILHLKRFDYDLVSLSRHKLNDQFEFPERIDMSPYKLDHLTNPESPIEEDIFELVGILVHSGTAETGHYYSFIRERPAPSGEQPRWFQFNDTSVSGFNPCHIGMSCFGGPSPEVNEGDKHFSAYMLFYERASKLDAGTNMTGGGAQLPIPLKVPVPFPIHSEIASTNEHHLIRYCLFDPDFPTFVQKLVEKVRDRTGEVSTINPKIESATMELLFKTLDRVVARTKDSPQLDAMVKFLVACSQADKSFAFKTIVFLADNIDIAVNLMIRGPKHRYKIQKHFEEILLGLRNDDPSLYGIKSASDSQTSTGFTFFSDGAFARFIERLEGQLSSLNAHDRIWNDYFKLVLALANIGHFETSLLLRYGFLEDCLSILLCDVDDNSASKFGAAVRYVQRADGLPPFKNLIKLLHHLFNVIDFSAGIVSNTEIQMEGYNNSSRRFPLTRFAWDLMNYVQPREGLLFLNRLFAWNEWIMGADDPNVLAEIVCLLTQQVNPNAPFLGYLFDSLKALDPVTSSSMVDQYATATVAFCRECPRIDLVEELIAVAAHRCKHLDGQAGRTHVLFFRELLTLKNGRIEAALHEALESDRTPSLDETDAESALETASNSAEDEEDDMWQGTFYSSVIRTAPSWAHALLQYETDPGVREQTVGLLNTAIFSHDPPTRPAGDSVAGLLERHDSIQENRAADGDIKSKKESTKGKHVDRIRARAVRALFYMCLQTCTDAQRTQMNKAFYVPMLNTIDRCAIWMRKLLSANGDEAEELKLPRGIQTRNKWFRDEDLLMWWQSKSL